MDRPSSVQCAIRRGNVLANHLLRRNLALSHTEGPTSPPLAQHTLPAYFDKVILPAYSDCSALISRHERASSVPGPRQQSSSSSLRWTFEEFDVRIAAASRGLIKIGLAKGDRLAVIVGNSRYVQYTTHGDGCVQATYQLPYFVVQVPMLSYSGLAHVSE